MSESEIKQSLSRRSFLKWSSVLGGSAVLASSLVACSQPEQSTEDNTATGYPTTEEGEWKVALCTTQFAGCGGSCVMHALVRDGQIVRLRTDASGEDTPENPQARCCVRGRQHINAIYAADRLKYPLKRKNWQPGGGDGTTPHLRGVDEWERITWDEAIDIVASETKRIVDTYGSKAILNAATAQVPNFMKLMGGAIDTIGASSYGAWYWTLSLSSRGPLSTKMSTVVNDKLDLRNSKLVVLWGANPAQSSQAQSMYSFRAMKEGGAKFIFVDPIYNESARVLADDYVPVRPSTDAALLLGIAYVMITNDLHDQEFLDKYCVGFDAEHMPEGLDASENYKDYVLGTYDGIPKTPEWASRICGTPPEKIESFAKEIASTKPMAFLCARSAARTSLGEQFSQNFLAVGWMTGNVGKPGACVGFGFGGNKDLHGSGKVLVNPGDMGGADIKNPLTPYKIQKLDTTDVGDWTSIHMNLMWDAVINGEYNGARRGMVPIDIRMISNMAFGNGLNQNGGAAQGIEAHRHPKIEFVVASDLYMTTCCLYADIVLPIGYMWEMEGISCTDGRRREMLLAHEQVIPPMYEVKTDIWVDTEIGKKLGFSEEELLPVSELQQNFNTIIGATVTTPDGKDEETLFTITQEDLDKYGVEGEPQEGKITIREFLDRGYYWVDVAEGDAYGYIAFEDYIADPEANNLSEFTQSGKFEIACQALATYVDDCGYDAMPKSPIGKYNRPVEGYEDTFSDWENQVKGDYPFQLITLHEWRSGHSQWHNAPHVTKAFPNDLLMNSSDADKLGIKTGDTVLITSKWGKSLRNAEVSERIMPGVIKLAESSWPTVDDSTGIDRAGASNYLCGPIASGSLIQPWNSTVANVEKWTGAALEPDYKWLQRVVEV